MIAVYTVGEICKKCYSCVRACPTKAISVHGGQAEIMEDLCISCGHCVSLCSQGAKRIRSSTEAVQQLLAEGRGGMRVALLAPSFPAAFLDLDAERLVGAVRDLGFDRVYEVAFGADLVSYAYHRLFKQVRERKESVFLISTPCPAVVSYVEKLFSELVPFLAPIVSPMEATARMVRAKVDPKARIVFIGPCVAKKDEAGKLGIVDQVLTFQELADLFRLKGIDPSGAPPVEFDPPHANLGRIYPVTGGLLKASSISSDPVVSPVYIVEGQQRVTEILSVLSNRLKRGVPIVNRLFDLLLCEGCIAGPAMPNDLTFYERRRYVVDYMKDKPAAENIEKWAEEHREYLDIDMSKSFTALEHREAVPTEEDIRRILAMTNKLKPEDELNCRACGYASCRDKAVAVFQGKAEVEMCLTYLIAKLETAINDLQSNQTRLIQAEKLASMGQMAAGIAHEINNPLGVLLMYSHLLKDDVAARGQDAKDVERIIQEAERTRKIVQGILNFARQEKIDRSETDINQLIREAAEGVRSIDKEGRIKVELRLDEGLPLQQVDRNQLRQVFDNMLKNAVEVMPKGGTITVSTQEGEREFQVSIADTGPGISENNLSKLFTPFFTTKIVGKGTGLGLAVCYGIVKMHGGSIQAVNQPGGGAVFTVKIRHFVREEQNVGEGTHR